MEDVVEKYAKEENTQNSQPRRRNRKSNKNRSVPLSLLDIQFDDKCSENLGTKKGFLDKFTNPITVSSLQSFFVMVY